MTRTGTTSKRVAKLAGAELATKKAATDIGGIEVLASALYAQKRIGMDTHAQMLRVCGMARLSLTFAGTALSQAKNKRKPRRK